ncbi:TM2 domain-containing protein [Agromyces atrinae]|uniref:TM2 domain-containing protein n=1 Tax=Agromyces atrinae TaxID=592376 RepID=UPI001F57D45A|nr:TM2 domain-containing protein [Agromyces atrinae]MCI2958400.1 TM2 domain-containing protein [Agromyces atrinae]
MSAPSVVATPVAPAPTTPPAVTLKSFYATWLLSILLGTLGADRFYLGKIGTGALKLVTLGGFGVWTLIDIALVLSGMTRDKAGRELARPASLMGPWIITLAIYFGGPLVAILVNQP